LGRKGGPFLPNLPLLPHKAAGGVAIMRIAEVSLGRMTFPVTCPTASAIMIAGYCQESYEKGKRMAMHTRGED